MKKIIFSAVFLFLTNVCFTQQPEQYKIHLFLGDWEMTVDNVKTIESWKVINDSEYAGKVFEIKGKDTTISETISLRYINKKLYYCPTVIDQNNSSEILFGLKSYENYGRKFVFENVNHDFPQRIIYDFSSNSKLNAAIEGNISNKFRHIDFLYEKVHKYENFTLTGIIRKQNFVNKIGEVVENVFDCFFEINGDKFFIKLKDSSVPLSELEKYIDKSVRLTYVLLNGLWDTDNPNHQSRIGNYIHVITIEK